MIIVLLMGTFLLLCIFLIEGLEIKRFSYMAIARFSLLLFLNKDVVLLGYIPLFACFVDQNMFLLLRQSRIR